MNQDKQQVHDFWNRASCGEELYLVNQERLGYQVQSKARYALEPYIPDFAGFAQSKGLRLLEIGVGLGADHQRFAEEGADLWGIDLTERAVEHSRTRLAAFGLSSNLSVGDAERLDFPEESFDWIHSWGVLHHSPDTPKAIAEVWRVLKPGGGENHDLPQVEPGRPNALGTLRIAGLEALVVAARDLCPLSGKPGHQGIFHSRGSGAVRQIQQGEYPHGADPRRSAGIRSRTKTSWPAAVAGAQALAKGSDSAAFAGGRVVHVN